MSKLSIIAIAGAMLASLPSSPLAAKQEGGFIDGFPDVPILDQVRGFEGETVYFDTLSGTVAEVNLLIEGGGFKVMEAYNTTLTALGWQCDGAEQYLRCERETNRLVFFDPDPTIKNGKIILRLEPVG